MYLIFHDPNRILFNMGSSYTVVIIRAILKEGKRERRLKEDRREQKLKECLNSVLGIKQSNLKWIWVNLHFLSIFSWFCRNLQGFHVAISLMNHLVYFLFVLWLIYWYTIAQLYLISIIIYNDLHNHIYLVKLLLQYWSSSLLDAMSETIWLIISIAGLFYLFTMFLHICTTCNGRLSFAYNF